VKIGRFSHFKTFTESSGSCKRIIFRTWRNMDYTEKDFKVMEKKSVKSVYKKI